MFNIAKNLLLYQDLYNPANIEKLPDLMSKTEKYKKPKQIPQTVNTDILQIVSKKFKNEIHVGKEACDFFLHTKTADCIELVSNNFSKSIKKFKNAKVEEFIILNDVNVKVATFEYENIPIIIYNYGEYELLPIFNSYVNFGCTFVILKFLLVKIWLCKLKNIPYGEYYYLHDKILDQVNFNKFTFPPAEASNYFGFNKEKKFIYKTCEKEKTYKPYLL
jgi:hypothetical protein